MKKFAMVMAFLLAMMLMVCAVAESGAPSKTLSDTNRVNGFGPMDENFEFTFGPDGQLLVNGVPAEITYGPNGEMLINGVPVGEGWVIYVTEENAWTEEMVFMMANHLGKELPMAQFFAEETREELSTRMAEKYGVEEYNIDELVAYVTVPVACDGYKTEYGDAWAIFSLMAPYAKDQDVVVLLGQLKDPAERRAEAYDPEKMTEEEIQNWEDPMNWTVLNAAGMDDELCVEFLSEVLEKMETETALMVVLSAPVEDAE